MDKKDKSNFPKQEMTITSVVTGIILACIFSGANAYLGLRVGLTVSASIPAAVVSMGIIRLILRKNSVLENNLVQTIGSAGESVAAGAIFTLPALFMWAAEYNEAPPSLLEIFLIALCGGLLGVMFMVPLRRALIVKEKDTLPFPEGTACAEVLLAGEAKGDAAATVFKGLGIAAVYKFVADGIKLFPSEINKDISAFKGSGVGISALPALAGVGYICGFEISSYMFGGGLLAWLVLMPAISFFAGDAVISPGTVPISEMGSGQLWSTYIRYVGAGAVAAGGIISLIKSLPLIISTFAGTIKSFDKSKATTDPKDTDLPTWIILGSVVLLMLIIWIVPAVPVTIIGALMIIIFGFFFTAVSSRMVGLVGSSNNPVSGMTIATLLIATLVLKLTGASGYTAMSGAIAIGSVICITASIAGDTSQDLKTGNIVGATPLRQQIGEVIGVAASALVIGLVLYLMNQAWGYGSAELPAPQATLMKLVVEGVMGGSLPWTLVIIGAFIAIAVELVGIPVLPFCIGLYLPFSLSVGIMAGGVVRLIMDKQKVSKEGINRGILYCSGLIAGEGITGILLAITAILPVAGKTLAEVFDISESFSLGEIGTLVIFALILVSLYRTKKVKK